VKDERLQKEIVAFSNGKSNEDFYKIDLSYEYFEEHFNEFPLKIWLLEILNFYKPKLIIPKDIEKYAKEGLTDDVEPFEFESNRNNSNNRNTDNGNFNNENIDNGNSNNRNIYIDNDRIGIELNCDKEGEESFFERLLKCDPKHLCKYWHQICYFDRR